MTALLRRFRKEQDAAALTEMAIVMGIVILTLAAFVELVFMVYTWNMATKALQYGSRLASISEPVDSTVTTFDSSPPSGSDPGDPIANGIFGDRTCTAYATASKTMSGSCDRGGTVTALTPAEELAMRRIMFGGDYDGARNCGVPSSTWEQIGMCDILPSLYNPSASPIPKIVVSYRDGALGYYDRPFGGVAVITIEIRDLLLPLPILGSAFRFVGGVWQGLPGLTFPPFKISAVSEDLSETF